MRPFISVVGRSETGKTTLLERLIVELRQRGYKLAVIKHAGDGFDMDKPGKDSWRFSQAGGEVVAVSTPHKVAVIKKVDHDLTPYELSSVIGEGYDFILAEGFKQSDVSKIEVHRKGQDKELLSPVQQLLAVITEEPLDVSAPQFSPNDIEGLADLIEKHIKTQSAKNDIELVVNDVRVPLNIFVKDLLSRTLIAMVSGLKGVREVKNLHISLRK